MPRICPILYLLLLFPLSVPADPARQAASQEGIYRLLNEEYDRAHAIFDSLIATGPDLPDGYLGRALAYWDESLLLKEDERYDKEIRRLLKQAIETVEARVRTEGESAEHFFWLGSAYGLSSGLALLRDSVIDGVVDALKSREFLEEAIRLDPDMVDAYFGLGLSDYIAARQPALLRMVSRIFQLPAGDRDRGLARLERVAREGVYTRQHAISSLAFIELYYEKNYEEARQRFADMHRRYPNSLDYRLRYLDAIFALTVKGSPAYRQALIDSVGSARRIAAGRNWKLDRWIDTKLGFIEGFGYYLTGQLEPARKRMETYVREAHKKSWLLGPAHLILGKLADLRGDRKAAVAHYRQVRKKEDVWGVHAEAKTYLERPFTGGEPAQRPSDDPVRRFPERP